MSDAAVTNGSLKHSLQLKAGGRAADAACDLSLPSIFPYTSSDRPRFPNEKEFEPSSSSMLDRICSKKQEKKQEKQLRLL